MELKKFIKTGIDVKSDESVAELAAYVNELKEEAAFIARFGHCTDEQRRFYETNVLELERAAEAARPAREAAEAKFRKDKEEFDASVIAAPRDDYLIYRDGHKILADRLVCSCGHTIAYNHYFEQYLIKVAMQKNGPSQINDIGCISGLRPNFPMKCDKCGKTHNYNILRVPE